MPSYPSSLYVPAHLVSGSTVLEASLLTDPMGELDALCTELGVNVHGSAGSLRSRIDMAMDRDGNPNQMAICDASDSGSGNTKRCRAGVESINVDDLTIQANSALGTVTFSPPLQATQNNVIAFLELQLLDRDEIANSLYASFVSYVSGSGTTTSFQFRVANGSGGPPLTGTSFLLHWFAVEESFSGSTPALP